MQADRGSDGGSTRAAELVSAPAEPQAGALGHAVLRRVLSLADRAPALEFNVTSICAYEALGSACLDPAAKTACNAVMARCGSAPRSSWSKVSRESCEAGVSGIADSKRRKFISCISESCRFETCLAYL